MDLFTTKIKLVDNASWEAIWDIINTWLTNSPHYGIKSIDYSGEETFHQEFDNKEIKIVNCDVSSDKIFALRFVNPENNNIWTTDCIYSETTLEKRVSITLSCTSNDYSRILPRIHKPYIIKNIVESGLCYTDGNIPISDAPIYLKETDLDLCAKIMSGTISTPLPVIYLSIDSYNPQKYSADEKVLAIKLSGIAHILVEPNKKFSRELQEQTNSQNPYNGYVGIYFSNSTYKEILSLESFYVRGVLDRTKMSNAIRATVQQALLNRDNSSDYTWSSIQVALHRKKYESESENAIKAKRECDDFIEAFDADINARDDKILGLQRQLDAKNGIIESLKAKNDIQHSISFKTDGICEFYNGELNDFILHLLSSVNKSFKQSMTERQQELLTAFLNNNKEIGTGKVLLNDIEKALKEKSLPTRRSMLSKCGFYVKKGSHDKVYFHNPKYPFTLANSPSEHRGDDNMLSDIKKVIDIYKKAF